MARSSQYAEKLRARRAKLKERGVTKRNVQPPNMRFPRGVVIEYKRDLRKLLSDFFEIVQEDLFPILDNFFPETFDSKTFERYDAINTKAILGRLKIRFEELRKRTPFEIEKVASKIGRFNLEEINRAFRKVVGIDITRLTPGPGKEIAHFVADNVRLIKSIDERLLSEMQEIVTRGVKEGLHASALKEQIKQRFGVSQSRADLIARDQVGKLNAALLESRQRSLGVKKYMWQTAQDERVRDSHIELNGKIFAWNDPPLIDGVPLHPGQDFQCRCVAIAQFEEFENLPELQFSSPTPISVGAL